MRYKQLMAASATPRHLTRATRDAGRQTRRHLLAVAARLFREHGLAGVPLSDIAAEADVFPSQITYYFGSKEACFVEAACREVRNVAAAVEQAGERASTPEAWAREVVETAVSSDALLMFVEAVVLARRRPELAGPVQETFARLHDEGARAVHDLFATRGWQAGPSAQSEARAYWAAVLGVAVERAAWGEAFDRRSSEAAVLLLLNLHGARAHPSAAGGPTTAAGDTR